MSRRKREFVRHALSLYLILALLLPGCTGRYGRVISPAKERPEIARTHSEFSTLANSSDLPIMYVSEGKVGISRVEAAMEEADAFDVQARAELSKQVADFNARRKELDAQVNKKMAEAEALRERYRREYGKALAQIAARESELAALLESKEITVSALVKENDSKRSDIIADAREKFGRETARIAQIREIHDAIEVESNARILEMTEASRATRERAAATVRELEAQATSVQLAKQARVDELEEQIKSTDIKTKAEVDRLKVLREAILQDSSARVKELRAKAATVQANMAGEAYQLKLTEAASTRAEAQAKNQEKSAAAPTRFDRAMAEIDRLRAEVRHHQNTAVAAYDSHLAEVQARLADELNEIKKIRASAYRAEQVAQGEFVKAEAAARAEAARRTAIHAEALAEAQKRQITAEAQAEAARIKQEVLEEIAMKKAAGRVEMDKHTTVVTQYTDALHQVPAVPQVAPVAPRVEPEHIAQYRISLAEVMRSRAQADAHELVATATAAEAQTNLLAVKAQEDAIAGEQYAIADALESQARARFSEIESKTEKERDVVESKYREHLVQAESFRKEQEAEALDYQSQATALEQITYARAEQLAAERQAVATRGANTVKELNVTLWAVQQRGDAEYSKLMAEARSISDSQEALALQIDAQIDAAGRSLDAELTKIVNTVQSAERIAQADYQEGMTQATVVQQKTDAEISRLNAQFAMEYAISKAQIERDKELALSQNLRGEAACDRLIADANTMRLCGNADIDSRSATAQADMNIILASNAAKRESAEVYLNAVKARFNARVQQVKAERIIANAGEENMMAMKRTDLSAALAEATAAREDSARKLAELKQKQSELQTASLVNWSDRLAMFKQGGFEFPELDLNVPSRPRLETPAPQQSTIRRTVDWRVDETR